MVVDNDAPWHHAVDPSEHFGLQQSVHPVYGNTANDAVLDRQALDFHVTEADKGDRVFPGLQRERADDLAAVLQAGEPDFSRQVDIGQVLDGVFDDFAGVKDTADIVLTDLYAVDIGNDHIVQLRVPDAGHSDRLEGDSHRPDGGGSFRCHGR